MSLPDSKFKAPNVFLDLSDNAGALENKTSIKTDIKVINITPPLTTVPGKPTDVVATFIQ